MGSGAKLVSGSKVAKKAAKPCHLSITRHLSKVPEIDAVYACTDDGDVIHVYSVVGDFRSKTYEKLLKKERLIEKDFPEISFDFHVRAHQGRKPERAVPAGSEPVFVK